MSDWVEGNQAAASANSDDQQPASAAALHTRGLEHADRCEYAQAVEFLSCAVALRPSVPALHIDLAEAFRNLGDGPRAAGCCRIALQLCPDYPEALNTLGLSLQGMGRRDEAVEHFRRAVELEPEMIAGHNNLGVVLQELGRTEEAITHFRRTVELAPDLFRARTNLGNALVEKGRAAEALVHFQEAVRLEPDMAVLHHNLGNALRMLDRDVEARTAYLDALRLDPERGVTHLHIGMTLRREGQIEDALPWYKLAVAIEPDEPSYWEQLGELQGERDEPGEAIPCWERVLALSPTEKAATHISLGWALQEEGRLAEARQHYQAAARLEPGSAAAVLHMGGIDAESGAMDAAEAAFRAALRLQPGAVPPHARLATLLRDKLPDADRAALEERLADNRLGPGPRARLLFGLAHVLDARGEYDRAARCLNEANALTGESARGVGSRAYDPADNARHVDGLLGAFDAAFCARTAGMGLETRRPVFVFGLPRSGTTLIEQVLASHPRVHGCGELRLGRRSFEAIPAVLARRERPMECVPHLEQRSLRQLAGQHLAQLDARDGGRGARIVDKMPDNTLYLGLLAALFPRATFLHCRRDLRDVAVSCWMTDFRTIRWAHDPAHVASRFRDHLRLMDHWRAVLPVAVHEVDYEETVTDLEPVARRLLEACGLDWDPACLEFHRTARPVRTASLTQVRQPLYTSSVARWKHYEGALDGLFAALPSEGAASGTLTRRRGERGEPRRKRDNQEDRRPDQ